MAVTRRGAAQAVAVAGGCRTLEKSAEVSLGQLFGGEGQILTEKAPGQGKEVTTPARV